MNKLFLLVILSILFFFIQSQLIFNINSKYYGEESYEFTISKEEEFSFRFSEGRGTPCNWRFSNKNILNEISNIQLIKDYYYDWISANNWDIQGGSEDHYFVFKALEKTEMPIILNYDYSCGGVDSISKVIITIHICESNSLDNCINNDKIKCTYNKENYNCISKTLCNKIEIPSESSCNEAITSTPSITRCIYNEDKKQCLDTPICKYINNIENENSCISAPTSDDIRFKCILKEKNGTKTCQEEEKFCEEILDGANDEICFEAPLLNESKTCVYDNENKKCIEVEDKKIAVVNYSKNEKRNKLNFLFFTFGFLYLLLIF